MEQIVRRDDGVYYGEIRCSSVDEAYGRYRRYYNESVGRLAFRRLNRLGSRVERVHGYGFDFGSEELDGFACYTSGNGAVKCHMMGLVCTGYCRMTGLRYMPDVPEDKFPEYIDWLFETGKGRTRTVGKKYAFGRTSGVRRDMRRQYD